MEQNLDNSDTRILDPNVTPTGEVKELILNMH